MIRNCVRQSVPFVGIPLCEHIYIRFSVQKRISGIMGSVLHDKNIDIDLVASLSTQTAGHWHLVTKVNWPRPKVDTGPSLK